MKARWAVVAISAGSLALSACFDPAIPQGLSCAVDKICPPGQSCGADSVCHTSGGSGPGIDARVECTEIECRGEADAAPPGGVSFGPPMDYPVGQDPSVILAADVNSDGHIDLLVANHFDMGQVPRGVMVFRGDGQGGFAVPDQFFGGGRVVDLIVGDFDLDGLTDFAWLAEQAGAQSIVMVRQESAGMFGAPTESSAPINTMGNWRYLHFADANGDGRKDLVFQATNMGDAAPYTYLPHDAVTNGLYDAAQELPLTSSEQKAFLGDMNRDGFLDVVGIGGNGIRYAQQSNDTPGTFGPAFLLLAQMGFQLIVRDINADGALDITAFADNSIWTILQDSTTPGAFLSPVEEVGGGADRIVGPDLNGDGRMDIFFSGGYSMLAETSAYGNFTNGPTVNVLDPFDFDIASDDFNEDGKPDIAILHRGDFQFDTNGFVRVYLQK